MDRNDYDDDERNGGGSMGSGTSGSTGGSTGGSGMGGGGPVL